MQEMLTDFIREYGYLSIFILIMVENILPPIPSELVLGFGGFMTTIGSLSVVGVVLSATAGSLVGAVLLYSIGLLVKFEQLVPIIKRSDLAAANTWFERYGYWSVFLGRLVPLIRSIISIPAGIARMKFSRFLLYTALGTLFWNALLVLGGASLGRAWPDLLRFMKVYTGSGVFVIGAMGVAYLGWRAIKRLV